MFSLSFLTRLDVSVDGLENQVGCNRLLAHGAVVEVTAIVMAACASEAEK